MMRIPFQIWIEPVRYRASVKVSRARRTDVSSLCRQAKVVLRATTSLPRRVFIYSGSQQFSTPDADYVGVPVKKLTGRVAALRALEALAHSFHDHAARTCVCGRDLFKAPP